MPDVPAMSLLTLPELSREDLAALNGWTVLRKGQRLLQAGAVASITWEKPLLEGSVTDNGQCYEARLDLRSLTFIRNQCSCPEGKRGHACPHAVAVYLQAKAQASAASGVDKPRPAPEKVSRAPRPADPGPPQLKSIKVDRNGQQLAAYVILPPNLEAAAKRNALVLKLAFRLAGEEVAPEKLYKGRAYAMEPGLLACLAEIERLSGGGFFSVIQMKRAQLRDLLAVSSPDFAIYAQAKAPQPMSAEERTALVKGHLQDPEVPVREVAVRRSGRTGPLPSQRARPAPDRPAAPTLPDTWMVIDGSPRFLSVLLKERDHPQYRTCVEWLRREGFHKEPSNGKWWLRDQHKVLNLLALKKAYLAEAYAPGYTENFLERTRIIRPLELELQTSESRGGYRVRLAFGQQGAKPEEIRRALLSGKHYLIQEDAIFLFPGEVLEKFQKLTQSLGENPNLPMTGAFEQQVTHAELARATELLEDDFADVLPDDWKARSAAIREVGRLEAPPLPEAVAARFRAYQLVGTAWLWHLHRNRLGGILADEMGLGKTIQAIGLLLCWQRERPGDPALIVAPASLLGNWQRELQLWAPSLRGYLHHGPQRATALEADVLDADWILTSYSTLRNDRDLFAETAFSLVIADEAQHVKNRRSHASRSLRALQADGRFVLTGTPIENSIDDLRSLFAFILPGYLKRPPAEARGEERSWHERQDLEKAAPYILRRAKSMVAPELPDKIEQTLWCPLSPAQQKLYQQVREKTEQTLLQMTAQGASENRLRFTMLTELLRLRQVCADPGLLDADLGLEHSAKFQIFRELLNESLDGGHRLLVFSQFVSLLKRLRTWLETEGLPYSYIDGSTRDRLAVCDTFNGNADIPVCLISLKAGGTGLNLTGADTVVHFDPWWNPAVEDQATDRAHRIGQHRTVTSYKLATEGTVEDKVLALQMKKAALLKDLLDESAQQSAKVDLDTLKSLLS